MTVDNCLQDAFVARALAALDEPTRAPALRLIPTDYLKNLKKHHSAFEILRGTVTRCFVDGSSYIHTDELAKAMPRLDEDVRQVVVAVSREKKYPDCIVNMEEGHMIYEALTCLRSVTLTEAEVMKRDLKEIKNLRFGPERWDMAELIKAGEESPEKLSSNVRSTIGVAEIILKEKPSKEVLVHWVKGLRDMTRYIRDFEEVGWIFFYSAFREDLRFACELLGTFVGKLDAFISKGQEVESKSHPTPALETSLVPAASQLTHMSDEPLPTRVLPSADDEELNKLLTDGRYTITHLDIRECPKITSKGLEALADRPSVTRLTLDASQVRACTRDMREAFRHIAVMTIPNFLDERRLRTSMSFINEFRGMDLQIHYFDPDTGEERLKRIKKSVTSDTYK